MNRYLLLRDNKQSGPYSVTELVEKGIKAYDLVWLDGRSAAWRYPSEIDELKAYAPAVEEQPYDRFYKKPSQQQSDQQTREIPGIQQTSVTPQTQVQQPSYQRQEHFQEPVVASMENRMEKEIAAVSRQTFVPATVEQAPRDIPTIQTDQPRKIYVTLPGTTTKTAAKSNISNSQAPQVKTFEPVATPVEKISKGPAELPVGKKESDPALEAYAPVPSDRSIVSGDNIAFPADTAWPDMDAPTRKPTLSNRKSRPGSRSNSPVAETFASFSDRLTAKLTQKTYSARTVASTDSYDTRRNNTEPAQGRNKTIMTVIVAVCLLLGGVIIGLTISNSKNESQAELDRLVKQIQNRQAGSNTAAVVPIDASTPAPAQTPASTESDQRAEIQQQPPVEKPRPIKQTVAEPVAAIQQQSGSSVPAVPVVKNDKPQVIESVAVKQENKAGSAEAEETRKNIRQLVTVQNNKYKTGVLGGISDLELTISNKSEYELDAVEVEVAFLGPERKVIRTQTIVFNNVKPGKTSLQEVPKSSRGVAVNTSIKSIQSKSLGLAYTGL